MSHQALEQVRTAWGDVFGAAPADPEQEFFAYGGNSILAIRLQGALLVRTGATLSVAEILEHRTIAAQAAHIAGSSNDESASGSASAPEG
ncbi:acyl carrier protein [Streptomyces sp. NBC_01411]|uniref:acyl carrier protein n=1 Tax=Streptomyces sp. NBC_01411 TaxID=2903857 RepID=UPI00324FC940